MSEKRECVAQLSIAGIPVQIAAQAFELNRSSWYYKTKPREQKKSCRILDFKLVSRLKNLSGYELTLGYRKIAGYLLTTFKEVFNHKKVYRHMDKLSLLQPKNARKPKLKKQSKVLSYCPLQSNMRWEADLTLVPTEGGFLYLFTVLDVFDKEVIGSWFGFRCRCQEAIESLRQAVFNRFPGGKVPETLELTLRLDRGCQFTALNFVQAALQFNLHVEFCDVQAPNQKPFIESFFSNFKREEVYRNHYQNASQALSAWENYVLWYNSKRPHGALNYLSPAQFRLRHNAQSSPSFIDSLCPVL